MVHQKIRESLKSNHKIGLIYPTIIKFYTEADQNCCALCTIHNWIQRNNGAARSVLLGCTPNNRVMTAAYQLRLLEHVYEVTHINKYIPLFIFRCFSKIAKSDYLDSSCLSVCPSARNNSSLTGQIFMKFDIWWFFKNLLWKFKFHLNRTRINGTLRED